MTRRNIGGISPEDAMAEKGSSRRLVDSGGSMLGIGIQLIVTILAFAAIGWWLDGVFDTTPWLLLAGLVFGATGGMISFIRTALKAGRPASRPKEPVIRHDSRRDKSG